MSVSRTLLVVTARPPWPPRTADAMTVDRLVRFLAGRGHVVDLACFVENARQEADLRSGLGACCRSIEVVRLPRWRSVAHTALSLPGVRPMQVQYYRSRRMRRLIDDLARARSYDAVYTHLVRMAEYTRHLTMPGILGVQISQALNLGRMVAHVGDPMRWLFYALERAKVRRYEARVCADYGRVVLCGSADVAEIEKTAPIPQALVCPHGQDVPPLDWVRAEPPEPASIVLSGVMSTYTNVDAAGWLATQVLPRVADAIPEVRCWIVGRDPQPAVRGLAREGQVVVTGEVASVSEWLRRAAVAVAPVRIAAGMQNKVLQAMACERPVVATPAANEGIGGTPGEHLLVADEPAAFARAIVTLLRDPEQQRRLGRSARAFVEREWTWEHRFLTLEGAIDDLVRGHGQTCGPTTPVSSLSAAASVSE